MTINRSITDRVLEKNWATWSIALILIWSLARLGE